MAGSVVVPDLEMTLMDTRRPSHSPSSSLSAVELMLLPAKYTSGVSFFFAL